MSERSLTTRWVPLARYSIAALLLLSAGLKASSWAVSDHRELDVLVALIEASLAAWLLTGIFRPWAQRALMLVFAAFAVWTTTQLLRGERSCGCFGAVRVHPGVSLVVDLLALSILAALDRVKEDAVGTRSALRHLIVSVACSWLVVGSLLWWRAPRPTIQSPLLEYSGKTIILKPEQWVGQRCPLIDYLPATPDVSQGKVTLVLFHRDCPSCVKVLGEVEATNSGTSGRAVLVELPPYGLDRPGPAVSERATTVRLPDTYSWNATTPQVITLNSGIVESVSNRLSSTLPSTTALGTDDRVVIARGTLCDLGYVRPGSRHYIDYTIRNTGDKPLVIRSVDSGCGCFRSRLTPPTIEAGGSGIVAMVFEAPDTPSLYSRKAVLQSTQQSALAPEILITARVGIPLRAEVLRELKSPDTLAIRVSNDGVNPIRLLYCSSTDPSITGVVPTTAVLPRGSLSVSIRGERANAGAQDLILQFTTDSEVQPVLEVTVHH